MAITKFGVAIRRGGRALAILGAIGAPLAASAQDDLQKLRSDLDDIEKKLNDLRTTIRLGDDMFLPIDYSGKPILVLTGALQTRYRFGRKPDAAVMATFLFGRADQLVFQVPVMFSDVSKFGRRGTVGFRVGHAFGKGLSLTAGVEQFGSWGSSDSYGGKFIRADQTIPIRRDPSGPLGRLNVQLGVGDGRFGPEGALNRRDAFGNRNPDLHQLGAYGGASISLTGTVARNSNGWECELAARYINNDWVIGTTVRRGPVFVTGAVADATGRAGDGARFVFVVGYAMPLGGRS